MPPDYITPEVRALIGAESPEVEATHPVEASEVRRFHHATMDDARRYWDEAWAAASRYGGVVTPPAFPVHAFRRAADAPDPLRADAPGDFGGYSRELRPGLPPVPIPLARLLNGGYEYELFRYARIGERIACRSRYKDIYQKDGRSGPIVFIVLEDAYRTASGERLLVATNTMILR
ncbi:MAG: MaoC family dehydratase N-terminal domain-containing protein [Vicinamibacterales bacterium]